MVAHRHACRVEASQRAKKHQPGAAAHLQPKKYVDTEASEDEAGGDLQASAGNKAHWPVSFRVGIAAASHSSTAKTSAISGGIRPASSA